MSTTAWVGASCLILVAPFETTEPWLRLPGQDVSSIEAILLVVVTAWLAALLSWRTPPRWRTPLTLPWIAVIAAALLAAVVSANWTNGVRMVGRFGCGLAVYLITVTAVTTPYRAMGSVTGGQVVAP